MDEQLLQQMRRARTASATRSVAGNEVLQLLDPGSIIEYGPLASATNRTDDDAPGDGLIAVSGKLGGHPLVVAAFDPSVLAGTISDRNSRKLLRVLSLAIRHRWPFVCVVDGDGSRTEGGAPPPILLTPPSRFDIFSSLAELSGWAPTIAIITSSALDAHASMAMMCDVVIATADATLGGKQSGTTHRVSATERAKLGDVNVIAADTAGAIEITRACLDLYLKPVADPGAPADGWQDVADIIPDNRRRPYDMRRIIRAIADDGSVIELGATHGRSMLTCFARLEGCSIGIFANQPKSPLAGAIDAAAADKAARFIELCDAWEFPLVSFIDNPGYMVGPQAEREGIARHHARPLSALHHRTVPLCSVQLRKAYGLGPYAMSGWGASRITPEMRLAWPSVESGGMSLEGAAYLVKRKEIQAAANHREAMAIRDAYADKMRDASTGLKAARAYMYDDVIEPADTRAQIAQLIRQTPRKLPDVKKHHVDPR